MTEDKKAGDVHIKSSKFSLEGFDNKIFDESSMVYGELSDYVFPKIKEIVDANSHLTDEAFDIYKDFMKTNPTQLIKEIYANHPDVEGIIKDHMELTDRILSCLRSLVKEELQLTKNPKRFPSRSSVAFVSRGIDKNNTKNEALQFKERVFSCFGNIVCLGAPTEKGTMTKMDNEARVHEDISIYWLMVMGLDLIFSQYIFKKRPTDPKCRLNLISQDIWIKKKFDLYLQDLTGDYVLMVPDEKKENYCTEILKMIQSACPLDDVNIIIIHYKLVCSSDSLMWNTVQKIHVPREGKGCEKLYKLLQPLIKEKYSKKYMAIYDDLDKEEDGSGHEELGDDQPKTKSLKKAKK